MEWQGYPTGDMNAFFTWLRGGSRVINATILGVGRVNGDRMRSIQTDRGEVEADYFLSTIPPEVLFLRGGEPMQYIGKTIAFLHVSPARLFPVGVGGVYFPDDRWRFNRIVDYASISDLTYPDNESTILGVEYPHMQDSQHESHNQKELDDAVAIIPTLWNCVVSNATVMSHPSIYPLRNPIQLEYFSKIYSTAAKQFTNFRMTGRYGKFVYVNMNDCFEMAVETVCEIVGMTEEQLIHSVGL